MKKILLVSPHYTPEEVKDRAIASNIVSGISQLVTMPFMAKKAFMAPLAMATMAALTPDDVEVDMWDEAVHGYITDRTDFKKDYDLVGITGFTSYFGRMLQLSQMFRQRGIPMAVGGSGVSAAPELYRESFDILFIGEAENTWPQFIDDWKAGSYRNEYRQVGSVDMAHSPPPRWDALAADMKYYVLGSVQTTRGCPFDCEFCDVIYLYGRQQRHKSIAQVLEELSTLERLGIDRVFLADDNFIGTPRYYKALLKELIPLNRSFRRPLEFTTQIDIRVAKDDEMLELLADANFGSLFIGIETPNVESLIEINKPQNYKTDIVADVKKIQSYGLPIMGGLIVGFDHDDTTIFQRQFEFVQESGVVMPGINPLNAPVGTKLWIRMLKEGRVLESSAAESQDGPVYRATFGAGAGPVPFTNITPKRMTRVELLSGYLDLAEQVRDWRNFEARVKGMVSHVQRRPRTKSRRLDWKQRLKALKWVIFDMDKEARRVSLRLVLYTARQAPFMWMKVLGQIVSQYLLAAQLPLLRESIQTLIGQEMAEGWRWQPKKPVFLVPEAFKKPYKAIFPDLYERVYRGLADKSRLQDTLVEVVYDFLTRWGSTFQQLEEYHRVFLNEICDRIIAQENGELEREDAPIPGQRPGDARPSAAVEEVPDIRHTRLPDAVLHAVEQELRGFQPAQNEPQSPERRAIERVR